MMPLSTLNNIEHLDLRALRWLILAQVAVVVPHLASLPVWLLVLICLLTAWRYSSFHGYGSLPGPWLRGGIVLASVGMFFLTFRVQFSVEAAVSFFAMTYALKVLEIRQRRDLYLFIFLSFFLLAMTFLFDQSLWLSLYVIFAVAICLIGLSSIANPRSSRNPLKAVARLMAQALPLVLIVYVLFPRVAPFWTVPLKSEKAWTGISDTVNPGDIAELAQSGERAFRVRFEGERPPQDQLYWRGLILDEYGGGQWKVSQPRQWAEKMRLSVTAGTEPPRYDYEIIQEPTGKPWGFALENPVKLAGEYALTDDGLVRFKRDLLQATRYRVGFQLREASDSLSPVEKRRYTELPPGDNPATRAWVEQLRGNASDANELAWMLMRYFREHPFFYTLRPPPLSGDQIDQFLFESQRGFCAHFASAFTFALRAAGVPARMVVGYQGGEWHPEGGYLMVHQYDAHAWTEVWIEGQGWVRFDPTAMVAPDRIARGIREAVAQEGSFLADDPLALSRYGSSGVLQWLRLQADQVNYNWQRWVVQYDGESQLKLFQRWYDRVDLATLGVWLALLTIAIMAALLLWLLSSERRRETDPVRRLYRLFEQRLARQGVRREPGETPARFAERIGSRFPEAAARIQMIHRQLEHMLYARSKPMAPEECSRIKRDIRRLRLKIR